MPNIYKILFLNSMIIGTIMSISSYSWMGMWMGLEINLLSIIPIINSAKSMYSSEASIKYFLTQTMASLILMFSILLLIMSWEFMPEMNSYTNLTMNLALLTKLGAAPFHFWFVEVMEGLNWLNCLIILTWQKIAPSILLMNNNLNFKFLMLIIISSLIISSFMSFNQSSLRKIITFSSINHIAWMLSAMIISIQTWMIYFLIYSITSMILILILNQSKSFQLSQLMNFKTNKMAKFSILINFLSLGGLPPLLGFIPKWLVIMELVKINQLLILIMIVFTVILLFVYTRTIFSSLLITHSESKFIEISNNFNFPMNFVVISSFLMCPMILT